MKSLLLQIIADAQKDLDTYKRILKKLEIKKEVYKKTEASISILELYEEILDDISVWELKAKKKGIIIEMANEKLIKIT